MRRWMFIRVAALVLCVCFGFLLGVYQSCIYTSQLVKEKVLSHQGKNVKSGDANEGKETNTSYDKLFEFIKGFRQGTNNISRYNPDKQYANILSAQTAKFNREARKYALVNKCCKKSKYELKNLSKRHAFNLFRHVIVDRKNKFLYCYVPKVASSNMKRMVLTIQGRSDNSDAIHYFDQRGFEFLADYSVQERQKIVRTFYKFLFVRDPLDRLVSAYRNKLATTNDLFHFKYGRYIVKRYRHNGSTQAVQGNDVTFREFMKYIIDQNAAEMNEHWMPIYDLCQPCYIPYDFVGSFENLDLDTRALLEKFNASKKVSFPKKQDFYQPKMTRPDMELFYYNITTEEYRSFHKKYLKDFQCFSYHFPYSMRHLSGR